MFPITHSARAERTRQNLTALEDTSDTRCTPRFIVGLPRSGTTWMCRSLNEHPDAVAFGETMFWGKSYVPPARNGRYDAVALHRAKHLLLAKPLESTAMEGPGRLHNLTPADLHVLLEDAFAGLPWEPTPGEVFTSVANAIASGLGKTEWVEKTPHHILYTQRILRHLPGAKFIVMMRDPYAFLLSYKHQKGHEKSEASRRRFAQRYHPVGGALVWRSCWRAARHLARAAPGQVLLVRTEEIAHAPQDVLRRVHNFLQLSPVRHREGITARVNSAFEGARASLGEADIGWMNIVAGPDILAAGYALQPSPRRQALLRSAADLPWWSVRLLADLRQTTSGSLAQHMRHWLVRAPNS